MYAYHDLTQPVVGQRNINIHRRRVRMLWAKKKHEPLCCMADARDRLQLYSLAADGRGRDSQLRGLLCRSVGSLTNQAETAIIAADGSWSQDAKLVSPRARTGNLSLMTADSSVLVVPSGCTCVLVLILDARPRFTLPLLQHSISTISSPHLLCPPARWR